jgi:uncharacterized protein (DUF1330 family)
LCIFAHRCAIIRIVWQKRKLYLALSRNIIKANQMKTLFQIAVGALTAIGISACAVAEPAKTDMTAMAMDTPVYMIAQIQIEDQDKFFNEYGPAAAPSVFGSGGKVLVATPTVNSLEGDWVGNWTVVIEFPSEEAALSDWYASESYASAIDIRMAATSAGNMVIAPGFVPPKQ